MGTFISKGNLNRDHGDKPRGRTQTRTDEKGQTDKQRTEDAKRASLPKQKRIISISRTKNLSELFAHDGSRELVQDAARPKGA